MATTGVVVQNLWRAPDRWRLVLVQCYMSLGGSLPQPAVEGLPILLPHTNFTRVLPLQNAVLQAEKSALTERLAQLDSQVSSLQVALLGLRGQSSDAKEESGRWQAQNSALQVSTPASSTAGMGADSWEHGSRSSHLLKAMEHRKMPYYTDSDPCLIYYTPSRRYCLWDNFCCKFQ